MTRIHPPASSIPKPVKLPLGPVADALADDEETLQAVLASLDGVWLTTADKREVDGIRYDYRIHGVSESLLEEAIGFLRKYLPDFTTLRSVDSKIGLWTWVAPDDVVMSKAEHSGVLERGGPIPEPGDRRVLYWYGVMGDKWSLYKRTSRKEGLKGWTLLWEWQEL